MYDKQHHFNSETVTRIFETFLDDAKRITDTFGHTSSLKFPPYNITTVQENQEGSEGYTVEYAVAGYDKDQLRVAQTETTHLGKRYNVIVLEGVGTKDGPIEYKHKGIANRNFEHMILIDDGDEIVEAKHANGILRLRIKRIPLEAKVEKEIPIS